MKKDVGDEYQKYNPGAIIPGITMPGTMQSYGTNNYMCLSCPNTSARESCWASFVVRPDEVMTGRLRRHIQGIIMTKVDTDKKFYDFTIAWRDQAINGIFHSGSIVRDKRSDNRTQV